MAPRNKRDKSPPGPTKNQLRNLQYNADASKPAFLRNALAALSGQSASSAAAGTASSNGGRVPVPTRPDRADHDGHGQESEEDEWDLSRGDEAPAVVVLKQGKHLDRQQVDELRNQAKANNESDPLQAQQASTVERRQGTLNFASGGGGGGAGGQKRARAPVGQDYDDENGENDGQEQSSASLGRPNKKQAGPEAVKDDSSAWESVISASKLDTETKKMAQEQQQQDKAKKAQEAEKAAKKKKKLDKKKIGMLSFDDE
ncbi:hypothetical protein OIV83_006070 [Microbotryomycetes sp. JL201]|nr:hypothetical protein OIV83_006070 [Microbotryomycetes sp. JL201]